MNLRTLYCTKDQAIRLKGFGIQQLSQFYFVSDAFKHAHPEINWPKHGDVLGALWALDVSEDAGSCSAFMVGELGVIIKSGSRTARNFSNYMRKTQNGGGSITRALNAEFIAQFILDEINAGRLLIDDCNERMGD